MPIEKRPEEYVGVRLTIEHRGPAAQPWWGFGLITRGATNAVCWGGAYHDIPAHADWTPVSYTFSWKLHPDMEVGKTFGCFAGLWPSAWKGNVYESSLITVRAEDIYQIVGVPAPRISSLSPSPCAIGAILEVYGSNFSPYKAENRVYFSKGALKVSVTPRSASVNHLTVYLSDNATLNNPANAGTWEVWVVRTPDAAESNHVSLSLTAPPVAAPKITSLSPSPCRCDQVLTINGSGFNTVAAKNVIYFEGPMYSSRYPDTATSTRLTFNLSNIAGLMNYPGTYQVYVANLDLPDVFSNRVSLVITAPAPGTAEYRELQAEAWSARIRGWEGYRR